MVMLPHLEECIKILFVSVNRCSVSLVSLHLMAQCKRRSVQKRPSEGRPAPLVLSEESFRLLESATENFFFFFAFTNLMCPGMKIIQLFAPFISAFRLDK